MRSSFHNALLQAETRYKDAVYHALDEEIQAAKDNVSDKCAEVRRGAYEAQDSFVPYRERGGAYKNLNAVNRRVQSLFEYLDTTAEKATGEKPACYSVFAAKGLEFSTVCVYPERMTTNQKVVSCTRATEVLYYYAV